MFRLLIFVLISLGLTRLFRQSLRNPHCHGFYRYLAFETILALVLLNHPYWFSEPFSARQLLSWLLLLSSIVLVLNGLYLLKKFGGHQPRPETPENLRFENTASLVSQGIYRYIRHPMYSSLLFLAWGAFLKHVTLLTLAGAVLTTLLLVITARVEERESLDFFGREYQQYLRETRMFIPFLF